MRIGIDISQIVHEGTGVASYVRNLTQALIRMDGTHEYVLFGASLRKRYVFEEFVRTLSPHTANVRLVTVPIAPTLLDILWNVLHIIPVESFIGKVDVFVSSDWTQPPLAYAKGITTVHDMTTARFPESFPSKIVAVQKRRLARALSECSLFLTDSQASKDDIVQFLHIDPMAIKIVYPGFSI